MLHKKYAYVCHAEVNAILNKGSSNVKDATLYVALFPCNECAKMIIQAGIKEVVYLQDHYHDTDMCRASRIMFGMAGVVLRQHAPAVSSIGIEFLLKNATETGCTVIQDNKDATVQEEKKVDDTDA
jgi:dCMP deaminase